MANRLIRVVFDFTHVFPLGVWVLNTPLLCFLYLVVCPFYTLSFALLPFLISPPFITDIITRLLGNNLFSKNKFASYYILYSKLVALTLDEQSGVHELSCKIFSCLIPALSLGRTIFFLLRRHFLKKLNPCMTTIQGSLSVNTIQVLDTYSQFSAEKRFFTQIYFLTANICQIEFDTVKISAENSSSNCII